MRKLIFVLMLALVFASCVCAVDSADYSKYKNMNLLYSIGSSLNVKETGSDARILEAEALVKLFPRKSFNGQKLEDFKIRAEPGAETDMNDVLRFYWENLRVDKISYGFDARIKTYNRFVKINREIKYPYSISDSEIKKYLDEEEFTDINEDIKNTARNIVGNEDDYFIVVNKVGNWVKGNINYNINSLTEKAVQKSSWVLENKEGVCDELTNLFISMLRSLGIPARFVSGTAYSSLSESWGNHGWAEVYYPGFGWVNYDVTYGQYGWIDPSHLKLSDSYDSGESSVDYTWRIRDLEISVDDLEINTGSGGVGELMEEQVSLKINPVYDEVKFGSFVPVKVEVSNLKNYYVSETISLIKAPKMLDAVNKIIWLKPGESKSFYWIVEIPSNLDKDYVFNALLEVVGSFGEKSESSVSISEDFKYHSYSDVVGKVSDLEKRQEKDTLEDVGLECSTDKKEYYSNENIKVNCKVENKGIDVIDLKTCLNDCVEFSLGSGEVRNLEFVSSGFGKKVVVAESPNFVKYFDVDVEVIAVPDIYVSDLNPREADYSEDVVLSFNFNSDFKAYDAKVEIVGVGIFELGDFSGEQEVKLESAGKNLINGLRVKMIYYDVKGKEYYKDETYFVEVLNVPWWRKLFLFFGV